LQITPPSFTLEWAPVGDVDDYLVQTYLDLFSAPGWLGIRTTHSYSNANLLAAYDHLCFRVDPRVRQPLFEPPPGEFDAPLEVTISSGTPGAWLQYELNGFITSNSPIYRRPIPVESTTSIRVEARKDLYSPHFTLADYILTAEPIVFDPPGGIYDDQVQVELSCASTGVVIHYAIDATVTTNSRRYLAPIRLTEGGTVHALAVRDDLTPRRQEATYSLLYPMLLWYPFNGNTQDESGNGNHGTVMNAVLCPDQAGTPDSAYDFNGVDSFIELTDGSILEGAELTFTAVVRLDNHGSSCCIVSKGTDFGSMTLALRPAPGGVGPPLCRITLPSGVRLGAVLGSPRQVLRRPVPSRGGGAK
jgi:hypothetical protein